MQPTENRCCYDVASSFDGARNRSIAIQRSVTTDRIVVVVDVLVEDAEEMTFALRNDVVRALTAKGADHSFAEWILPRAFARTLDFFEAESSNLLSES